MKHLLLFGLLLALTASCKNTASHPASSPDNAKAREAERLLAEANELWSPAADSAFAFHYSQSEQVSVNDKAIREKLDSALLLDPHNIKVYLGKTSYLTRCRKFSEILPILREAARNVPFNADLWSMKAIFEDYYGDSLIAQKDYHSADSAFALIKEDSATDSLLFATRRLGRALNRALMTDDFVTFETELKWLQRIFPQMLEIKLDSLFYSRDKKEFFQRTFGKTE